MTTTHESLCTHTPGKDGCWECVGPAPAVAPTLPSNTARLDSVAQALTLIARADEHAADARAARNLDDHRLAGRFREEERGAMQRAKLLVEIAQTEALDAIADAARRIALAL